MDKEELIRKCILTIGNYGQMANRLEKRNNISQFILLYYSIVGIVDSLIPKFFDISNEPELLNTVFDFWDIIMAIILLIFSSQVALLKYSERIKNCIKSLNELKSFLIKIQNQYDDNTSQNLCQEYNTIISNIDFLFSRTDFYNSCIEYDKKTPNSKEKSHHFKIAEIGYIKLKLFLENSLYCIVIVMPFIMYALLIIL